MWMFVMFDLPVADKESRLAASQFRNKLLDMGFQMSQFSIYYRCCGSKDWVDKHVSSIEKSVPAKGKVNIIFLTDKQFAAQKIYYGAMTKKVESHEQLMLF